MDTDTNVNSELSELVKCAEHWVHEDDKPNSVHTVKNDKIAEKKKTSTSINTTSLIYESILGKAACLLLNQMGIKTAADLGKLTNVTNAPPPAVVEEHESTLDLPRHDEAPSEISSMEFDELRSIIPNECCCDLPHDNERWESYNLNHDHFALHTPTKISTHSLRRLSRLITPIQEKPDETSTPVMKSASKDNTFVTSVRMARMKPEPKEGETPHENRASRLRREIASKNKTGMIQKGKVLRPQIH